MLFRKPARSFAALIAATSFCTGPAGADDVADFYRTHGLTLLIGTSTGGGYDLLGRFLGHVLARYVPGNPRIVVKNMAGAGGIVAGNYLYANAPRDGSVVAGLLNNVAFEPLFGTTTALYDATKFNWIGSSNAETAFLMVWHTVPVNTLRDAQTHEITVGTSGVASAPTFFARLLNETLHTRLKIIPGYSGSNEAFLAIERGELDGYGSAFTSDLTSFKPQWLRDRKVKLIVQYGPKPEENFANVPFAPDVVTDPNDKALMRAAFALLAMGRPYAMPPGVPADRVAAMRKAFFDAMHDPEVIAEASKAGIGLDHGQSGEDVQKVVVNAYATAPAEVERLKKLKVQ
jgi:tripartite-type tricarboxylate transporter receptor subunit TctC